MCVRGVRRSRCATLLWCVGLFLIGAWNPSSAAQRLTYRDFLRQLTDLDRLTRLQTGVRAGQFSSWDRGSYRVWGANGDAGHYLRVEENGEAVMMDIDGPGCIFRIWSANPQGKIRVYLDGATEPTYEWDFARLFTGELPPFIRPLVYQRGGAMSASDCYLPIPFARHIKITADRRHVQYYHFNYLLYPSDWQVPSFRLPLSPEEQAALDAAARAWSQPGRDPKPRLPGQRTILKTVTLRPGQTVRLFDASTPGVIRAIRARVQCAQRYFWRKLVLRGTWDDASWPQVLAPLGPFFGFDWETPEYGSLIAGCQKGQAYFFYPMPFRRSARLDLTSFLEQPATVTVTIDWAPVRSLPSDDLYFYARWRCEPDCARFDYPFLETAGRGHFVGVSMPIDHPLPGWWGEGDEKVWVDGDDFPSWIGTGSEDYFGDAWGIRYLPGPSFGCSYQKGHRTCNYRWHFMDLIPFTQRFRMTIENYGPNGVGPRGHHEYSSVAYWYQAERTPPFARLRGATYTGGLDPGAPPQKLAYEGQIFQDVGASALRTYGRAIPFTHEAERLFSAAVAARKAKLLSDARLPFELNREQAVDFGSVAAGQVLADCTLTVSEATVYFPKLHLAPVQGAAALTLEVAGQRLPVAARPQPNVLDLGGVHLARGQHRAALVAVEPGRAVVDCLELMPAQRESGALEAEELAVVSTTGGAPRPKPSEPVYGASAGRVLDWVPEQPGQGLVLRIQQRPKLPYTLGVRPLVGPDAGIIQAFEGDRPLGPSFDLWAPEVKLSDAVYPLGPLPEGNEVEIRVVGKNPQSRGYRVALDTLRFEPTLLGPDTAEGVWARVLGTGGCAYLIQDLGEAFSGGHHLWLQPSSHNAWVDIALEIPREGDYEISVPFTTSWDYAIVQAYLDGQPLGPRVDTYTEEVRRRAPETLGRVHLTAGQHVLRFQAVDKNPQSRGYLMGIDHITVR